MFFNYGYNDKKSKVLFPIVKDRMPNAFSDTAFRKHLSEIIARRSTKRFSKMFLHLPSTTDGKESINQSRDNVNLNPVNCWIEGFKEFSPSKQDFFPNHLDYKNKKRNVAVEIMLNVFMHAVGVSNSNLIRNAAYLLSKSEEPKEEITWVGLTKNPIWQYQN